MKNAPQIFMCLMNVFQCGHYLKKYTLKKRSGAVFRDGKTFHFSSVNRTRGQKPACGIRASLTGICIVWAVENNQQLYKCYIFRN